MGDRRSVTHHMKQLFRPIINLHVETETLLFYFDRCCLQAGLVRGRSHPDWVESGTRGKWGEEGEGEDGRFLGERVRVVSGLGDKTLLRSICRT